VNRRLLACFKSAANLCLFTTIQIVIKTKHFISNVLITIRKTTGEGSPLHAYQRPPHRRGDMKLCASELWPVPPSAFLFTARNQALSSLESGQEHFHV
jgi:hypothetical protein